MKTDVFHLQIIPIDNILPHEFFDGSRSKTLAARFGNDGLLCNPIIVAPLSQGKFVQLDGMNRLSTFKLLGYKSILCQIVDYQDMENVELASWVHFINSNPGEFQDHLKGIKGILIQKGNIDEVKNRYVQSEGMDRIATFISEDYTVSLINFDGNLFEKVAMLTKIVDFYSKDIIRDVLPPSASAREIKFLFREHMKHKQMLVFPTFTRHQIVKVVKKGGFFPAGITRHVIRRRCLNVDVPLTIFDNGKSLDEQNIELEKILRNKKFRLYVEPTIYFE